MPVKKGKSITGKYYKDVVLKKLKKYYRKRRPATGFKYVRLLRDNAPAHTSAIVTAFLKKEKVIVLPHPPYSPDLAPCDIFLFPKLKSFLARRQYHFRQAFGSAIHQYLITMPKSAYREFAFLHTKLIGNEITPGKASTPRSKLFSFRMGLY